MWSEGQCYAFCVRFLTLAHLGRRKTNAGPRVTSYLVDLIFNDGNFYPGDLLAVKEHWAKEVVSFDTGWRCQRVSSQSLGADAKGQIADSEPERSSLSKGCVMPCCPCSTVTTVAGLTVRVFRGIITLDLLAVLGVGSKSVPKGHSPLSATEVHTCTAAYKSLVI